MRTNVSVAFWTDSELLLSSSKTGSFPPIAKVSLTAPHPSRALAYNENHYNFQTQTGGYLAPLHVPHKAIQEVVNNTRQLLGKQIIGTPSIALQLVPGKTYFFIAGVIPSRRLAHIIPLLSH